MVDFADYPVESQSFPRGQKAIFEAKGRSMDHWREEGKVWAALSFLVQILVQKVIQHQKSPSQGGFVLYHLMPIAGIEPVTYALRVRCSTN